MTAADARERRPAGGEDVWMPPELRRFQPGDRVRVHVNFECRYCLDPRFPKCYEQALADDGRTATVYDVGHDDCSCRWDDEPPDAAHIGHDVWVTWDERRDYDEPYLPEVPFDAHFAASELRLLTDALPPDDDDAGEGGL